MASRLHAFLTDNLNPSGPHARGRVDRSLTVALLRGEAARCRVLGHRPVIGAAGRFRWVECARCLTRPEPPLSIRDVDATDADLDLLLAAARRCRWAPRRADLSVQLVVRPPRCTAAVAVSADGPGGEHDLGLHLALPGVAVYLRQAGYGRRLTSRMPLGAERVLRLEAGRGYLWWDLCTDRTAYAADNAPSWRLGYVEWADVLLGRRAYDSADIASKPCVVPMPEGGYPGVATLRRETGRRRGLLGALLGNRERLVAWVECDDGIPVPGGDCDSSFLGDGVRVAGAELGRWASAGVEHVARSVLSQRARRPDWVPSTAGQPR